MKEVLLNGIWVGAVRERAVQTRTDGISELLDRLGAAFGIRDVVSALGCFVPDDDITYVGPEHGESATGRILVGALLARVFARPEAYSWRIRQSAVHLYADCAYVMAEADGQVATDNAEPVRFKYRISGVLESGVDGWRLRLCHGCEPTPPCD